MKLFLSFFLTIAFFSVPTFADFDRTSGLIDIPTANILPSMAYRIGFDGSIALDSDHSVDDLDENIHTSLGLGDVFEGYLDIYTIGNFTAAMGFCHRLYKNESFALAWGIHQLSYALDVSEVGHGDSTGWDDDLDYSTKPDYEKPFEFGSAFLVSTFSPYSMVDMTFGLGRGRYVGYGPHSKFFNSNLYHEQGDDWGIGLILGMELKATKDFSLLFDLDGRDANVGLKIGRSPIEFAIALTKFEQFGASFSPRISASISYVNLNKKEPIKKGAIAGVVMGEDSVPLTALVRILNTEKPKVLADSGLFTFKDLEPDTCTVAAWSTGYEYSSKKVMVSSGKTTRVKIVMKKKKLETGSFIGKIFDLKTKQPLVANLSIKQLSSSVTSDTKGDFGFENLKAGIYDIKAEAEGYEPGIYSEVITAGEKNMVEIGMVKRGMVITLKGIKFDFNKATIKPESYPILDEAAGILKTHPDIKVELQGHTDSVGSDAYNLKLSQNRANSVRDYLISSHSINAARLMSRGYGERKPITTNRTEEGRAQNRRVDFVILK